MDLLGLDGLWRWVKFEWLLFWRWLTMPKWVAWRPSLLELADGSTPRTTRTSIFDNAYISSTGVWATSATAGPVSFTNVALATAQSRDHLLSEYAFQTERAIRALKAESFTGSYILDDTMDAVTGTTQAALGTTEDAK